MDHGCAGDDVSGHVAFLQSPDGSQAPPPRPRPLAVILSVPDGFPNDHPRLVWTASWSLSMPITPTGAYRSVLTSLSILSRHPGGPC
jgi:hypothetical protein